MVQLRENELVITIPHESPADFLGRLQSGILEMVKSLLSVSGPQRELVLDSETSEGCIHALGLVQATLADPNAIQLVQELADRVMPPHDPPE